MTSTPHDLEFMLESVTAGDHAPNERMSDIEKEHRPWVCDTGVHALGIGEKITDGADTGELALRVYVGAKKPLKQMDMKKFSLKNLKK